MTDIIFLLLLFFMITATVVQTNAIKVMLPQSSEGQKMEKTIVRITLDEQRNFYVAKGQETETPILFDDIEGFLQSVDSEAGDMYVALYADSSVPYGEIVKILDVANRNQFKLVLATTPLKK
jgi:biopolymer transport protein ExbD